jgi:DNA gyrase subunit A
VNRTDKTGDVVTLMEVLPEDEIMVITKSGMIIRSPVSQLRIAGRNTQGVRLVDLDNGDMVTAVARVVPEDDKSVENGEPGTDSPDEPELMLEDE